MKNIIIAAAIAATAIMAVSCEKDKLETGNLTTDNDVICFPSGGGSYDINLNSDTPWTTVSLHDWVTVTPESGNSSSIVTISVDKWNNENSEEYRGAKVVFLNDSDTLTTYIQQMNDDNEFIPGPPPVYFDRGDGKYPNTLYISGDDSATVPAQGGDVVFNIVADCQWWIECDASWLTISPTSEWGGEEVTVNVGAWEDAGNEESRSAAIKIYHEMYSAESGHIMNITFTVTQVNSSSVE